MTKCIVPDCEKPQHPSGGIYCSMHQARLYRYGRLYLIRRQNGTGNINAGGYVEGSVGRVRKYEHVRIAEAALGKSLPKSACVHHVNEDRTDNRPSNLVICPSDAYHKLLHRRMRAREECGNPNWVHCWICDTYDAPENLDGKSHLACKRKYARERYQKRKSND